MSPSVLLGATWFIIVYVAIVWVWGLDPHATASPDEAVNRLAAALLREHGSPFIRLPFPDPEDLAHPRSWISLGEHAIPSYSPVAIYWYAFCLCFGKAGLALVAALPASATAAFAIGTARLLPSDRQWLALPAPLLGSPAFYWLIRPWINLSVLLSCVCWAFFFWASFRRSGNPRQLTYAALGIGAAAAVRPDYAAYLFIASLLLGLAAGAAYRRRVVVSILAAGAAAVAVNLVLNRIATGHALVAAYQIEIARSEGADATGSGGGSGVLRLVVQLLAPMGVPTVQTALRYLGKYWLHFGAIGGLAVAQLALIPLLLKQPRQTRVLHLLALASVLCFMLSRMALVLYGTSSPVSMIDHSVPRYWSPVYLLAAVPPIVFLGQCKERFIVVAGALFLAGVAVGNGYDICVGTRWSLVALRAYQRRDSLLALSLTKPIPKNAWVYSARHDKILWSYWPVGTLGEPGPTARSMARALEAGVDVFVFEPKLRPNEYLALDRSLQRRGLSLAKLRPHGLFHVVRE